MSGEHLLIIIIVVGIVAGWLAGLLVAGGGFGLFGDLIVGIVGAFIGNYLFAHFHWHLGTGALVSAIIQATVGAVILLFLLRLVGGFGYRRY